MNNIAFASINQKSNLAVQYSGQSSFTNLPVLAHASAFGMTVIEIYPIVNVSQSPLLKLSNNINQIYYLQSAIQNNEYVGDIKMNQKLPLNIGVRGIPKKCLIKNRGKFCIEKLGQSVNDITLRHKNTVATQIINRGKFHLPKTR